MEQKHQVTCPICGKFTTEASKRKYDELVTKVQNLSKAVEYHDLEKHADEELLEKKRKTIKELSGVEARLRERVAELRKENDALLDEVAELRLENERIMNRSFIDRLFNK